MTRSAPIAPIELFFDLVFVLAFAQLSHHLVDPPGLRALAESAVLLVVVLNTWISTSWLATLLGPERRATAGMLLAVMAASLFLHAILPRAFADQALAFAALLGTIQLGRTLWALRQLKDPGYRAHYRNTLIWVAGALPLWIGGAFLAAETRLWAWGLAAGLDLLGLWLAHALPGRPLRSARMEFDADHMLERCSLLLLVALGETILGTGRTAATVIHSGWAVVSALASLGSSVALFTVVFGAAWEASRRRAPAQDQVHVSRHAAYGVLAMSAGLVALASASDTTIAEPLARAQAITILLMGLGPTLFLAGHGWFLHRVHGTLRPRHGLAFLGVLALGLIVWTCHLPNLALSAAVALILVAFAWGDKAELRRAGLAATDESG